MIPRKRHIGEILLYGIISLYEVLQNTGFISSINNLISFRFFIFRPKEKFPLESLRRKIIYLNVKIEEHSVLLRTEYNVQDIISVNKFFQSGSLNQ